ncbi:MAG: hypothetical protein COW00_13200 [Bdellovibrio sp. CG12_big_fil_rev_8_21_14_0_65_39_13]|nr:MAG: hypothetical protein COW78_11250 [Bdellovibrio sp. CG22_combo_CG10-13_8_21_14_all_39_27]PIQ58886.1 MAG: hypothetical protein COW00_13200 [Bdellovibrio sp. CG12_big_fil_rev_8_21_14_0_65_39_13]PIR35977.1 MAG: hypothetical protein COV37_05575 [Bdellovibrio sp. CG11_big_fil_rev_8_21_14_0_20_39_38]PJB53906.1 MAG: hypothetical protein CO099_04515 [Bdellovibrio sp. CG_4_9_14_3_um_filter_39_7]
MKLIFTLLVLVANTCWAGPKEQAYQLHNRLTSVPPSPQVLQSMQFYIQNGEPESAAMLAMEDFRFYNVTLKNWVKKWTNQEQTNRVPLNDFVATVLGFIKDDLPFNGVLTEDILYTGASGLANVAPYAPDSNDHYRDLENTRVDLKANLVRQVQSQLNNIPDTAGVLTSRAAGESFYSAGTNRRVTRFAFMNFMCKDFEALHDITLSDVYVRRDVDRRPGGDSRTFRNKCVGCHSGQDALGGAWSYFDWDGTQLVYSPGQVVEKINKNNLFAEGNVVADDSWVNMWANGQNSYLGWRGAQTGRGARSLGRLLASSQAFSQCMAERVFELVCLKKPVNQTDIDQVKTLAMSFEQNGRYSMKQLVAKTSILCLGE